MGFPSAWLIHSCQVETSETYGTEDIYNIATPTKVYTTVSCRFVVPKLTMIQTKAGQMPDRGLSVILPAGTTVTEGKTIIGAASPYNKTYTIKGGPREILLNETVSHIICDLERVG